ncbi:MAG: MarC family protein [Ignavibacteriaceae bacterium]
MDGILVFASTVFMGFFAIMNPIGNMPIFLGLVEGIDKSEQKKIAWKSVSLAFIIVAAFSIFGSLIFKAFGITLPAFQIGGGLLIFIVGYQLLQGKESAIHHPAEGENDQDTSIEDIAISPLAIPILAGPGTISTAMNFVGVGSSVMHVTVVIGVFALICIITFFCFVFGENILLHFKKGIVKVITRLMGLIITIISVQMVIAGIHNAIKMK